MSTELEIEKWRVRFAEVIQQMEAGSLDSCMLITANGNDPDILSGAVTTNGMDVCLAYGVELAIEFLVEAGIDPLDDFGDEEFVDLEDFERGPVVH